MAAEPVDTSPGLVRMFRPQSSTFADVWRCGQPTMQDAPNPTALLKKYITEEDLAKALSLSVSQMANLRARRLIPYLRIGRSIRYEPIAVNSALQKLTVGVPA